MITFYFVKYLNDFALRHRIFRRDLWHSRVRSIVRVIMSKFEILQSKKIDFEINAINTILSNWYKEHENVTDYIRAIFYIPLFVIWITTTYFVWTYWNTVLATWSWFGELSALLIIMWLIAWILDESLDFYRDFTKEWVHFQKVISVFDDSQIQWGYDEWEEFIYKNWSIELKNITYWYTVDDRVFDDFSTTIQWSKKTAFVWVSGSWKSTLVKLIAWYINPDIWDVI